MGDIKQAYIEELKQRLSDWLVELGKLNARMDKANVDNSHKLYVEIHALRNKCDETKAQLEELREVEHDDWQHFKETLDNAWHHLSEMLTRAGKGFEKEFRD